MEWLILIFTITFSGARILQRVLKNNKKKLANQKSKSKGRHFNIYKIIWDKFLNEVQKNLLRDQLIKGLNKNERVIFFTQAKKKAESILRKKAKGKPLTNGEKRFLKDYEEFLLKMGDWNYTDKFTKIHSSWLLSGRFLIRKNKDYGVFQVRMIRSNKVYIYPRFPKEEYLALISCTSNAGSYWWNHNLNRYSANFWKGGKKK